MREREREKSVGRQTYRYIHIYIYIDKNNRIFAFQIFLTNLKSR